MLISKSFPQDWSLVPDRCRLGCDKRYRVLYNAKLKWMRKDRENGARHRSSSESRERPRANTRERSLSRRETSMEQKGGKVDTPRGRDGSGRSFSGVGDRGKAPREQTPRADTGVGDREKAPGQETPRAQSKGRDGDSERALKDCDTAAKGEGKVQKMVAEGGKRPPEEGGSVEPGCLSLSPDSTTPADVQKESDVQLADGVNLEKAELADERKLGKVELGEGVVEADGSGEGVVKGGAGSGGTEVGKIDRDMDGSVNEGARSEAGGVNTVSNPGREEVAAPTEERLVKEDSSGEEADPTQKELNLVEPEPGAVKEERASERFILKDPPEPKKRPFLFDLNEPPPVEIEDEDEPLDGSENGLAGRLSVIPPGEETPSNAGEAMEGPTQQMESAPEERSQDWDEDEGPELPPGFEGFYLEQSVRSMGPIGDGRGELGSVDQDCAAVLEELQGLPRGEADVSKDGDVSEHASREEVSRARRARWEAIRRRVDAEGAGEKTEPEATRGGGPEETGAGGTEETMGGGTEGTRGGGTEGTRGGGTEEDADAAPLEWLLREAKELAQRIKSKEQRGQKAGSTGAESRALPAQGGGSLSGARGVGGTPGADGDGESVPGGGRNVPPDPEPEATAARLRTEVGDAKAALGKIQEQLNKQFGIRLGPERSKTGNAGAGKTQDGGEVETGLRVEREDTGLLGEGKGGGAGWVLSAVRTSETKRKDASEMSKAGAQASGKEPEKVRGFWEDGEEGGLLPAKARLLGRKTKIQFGALEGLLEKGRAVGAPKQGPGVSRHQNGEGNQRGLNLLKQPKVSVNGAIAKSGARVKATGLGGGNWAPQSVAVAVPPVVGRAFMKVKEGTRQIAMWELDTALQERFYGRYDYLRRAIFLQTGRQACDRSPLLKLYPSEEVCSHQLGARA